MFVRFNYCLTDIYCRRMVCGDISFTGFWATVLKRFALCYRTVVCPGVSCLSCLFVALVYCSQTAGWIKMPLGTEICLGPCHIVLNGDPAPPRKGAQQPPTFRRMSIVAKLSPISAYAELACVRSWVTPSTKSTNFGSRYLLEGFSEREES